jgi:hypothetical protein
VAHDISADGDTGDPVSTASLPTLANGVVDPQLLSRYLTLQIEALEIEKAAREERARTKLNRRELIRKFGPPSAWIAALLILGAMTAKLDSGARLDAVFFHQPPFVQRLTGVWKVFPQLPSPDQVIAAVTPNGPTSGHARGKVPHALGILPDASTAALKAMSDYRDVLIPLLALVLPGLLTALALILQTVVTRKAGAVIGSLLTIGMASLFLAAAVAWSDWHFTTGLVLALIAISTLRIMDRLASLALEFAGSEDPGPKWFQPVSERFRHVIAKLLRPAGNRLSLAFFVAIPLVANVGVVVAILARSPDDLVMWTNFWTPVMEIAFALVGLWLLWACLAAVASPNFFHPVRNRRTLIVFVALPIASYTLAMVAMVVGLNPSMDPYDPVYAISAWTFIVTGVIFLLWAAWGVVCGLLTRSFLHPSRRRATLATFVGLPLGSVAALVPLALAFNAASPASWWFYPTAFSVVLIVALFSGWILWVGLVMVAKLSFAHPFRRPVSAVAFLILPGLAIGTMLLTWESANGAAGSILFELAALLFTAWCLWMARLALANPSFLRPPERSLMRRAFIAIPAISLMVLVIAAGASGMVMANPQVWRSVPGFIWGFLFSTAALSYVLWFVWAWLILPRQLRPVFVPVLIFMVAAAFLGPILFVFTVAALLALTLPTSASRAMSDLINRPVVRPSAG